MPNLSLSDVARIAHNLGHRDLTVDPLPYGTWWIATCSCGYRSTRRRTPAQAASAAAHHLELLAAEWAASGAPFPAPPVAQHAETAAS